MSPGEKRGRLTMIRRTPEKGRQAYLFRCDCGNETVTRKTLVVQGHTRSCGCLRRRSWRR